MTLTEAHDARKQAILGELRALAALAGEVGMESLRTDLLETRIPKLEDERFHLVVLGEFNHGKSTFVNALLGAEVLPTGITPTTAAINHVVWAERPCARAVLADGRAVEVPLERLADWVTVAGVHAREVRYVEVGYPAEILRGKITLVDTPGVNDLNDQRAEITYGYLPRADAVLFLLDAGQALKESERAFLTSRVLERSRDRMIFVLGKKDLLSDEDVAQAEAYVRQHLRRLLGDDPPLFAVSARRHLAGDTVAGAMDPLLGHLSRFLAEDRGRLLLDNAAADALRTAAYLRQNLGVKKHTLALSLAELEERIERVRRQLAVTQKQLAELHGRIQAEAAAVKAQVRLDLDAFASRFVEALPREIERVDAGDVKRYLPLFIQDKFKEFAEAEGARLARLLERLTEEVIAVTNESTRAATAALGDRLGPGDTAVELDVDSFKYDVSIYAVGALGTTIFLFVNGLVGGLLTLAAPILAIVFQSKVAAEIKEQARQRAPEAVRRAAAAIAPHFDRLVDDFAARLDDFVTSAGDRLFRGIEEVLAHAIDERRRRGGEIAPLAQATEEQLARLIAIENRLAAVRGAMWAP